MPILHSYAYPPSNVSTMSSIRIPRIQHLYPPVTHLLCPLVTLYSIHLSHSLSLHLSTVTIYTCHTVTLFICYTVPLFSCHTVFLLTCHTVSPIHLSHSPYPTVTTVDSHIHLLHSNQLICYTAPYPPPTQSPIRLTQFP